MTSCFKTYLKENKEEAIQLNSKDNNWKNEKSGEKELWGNKAEFLLASIGLAVGLGNVWRFPYLCQKNGGGAFLIPYVIMMIFQGFPLFIVEFAVGQRFRRSSFSCWKEIHPALTGIGISSIILSTLLCIYYIAVIAWSIYYTCASFTVKLPWDASLCPSMKNVTIGNITTNQSLAQCCRRDPESFYFYENVLGVSSSIESSDGKPVSWELSLCLILSWIVVYACVLKGVKSSGKAVYFTATFPYVILVILLIFGATLEGADIGLIAFFKPDFTKLSDPRIWLDAAGQMFFTLSLGFGALIAFASHMPVKNNCMRDAYTVVTINCSTSLVAGIVVFSILGNREVITGQPAVESGGGPGLVFITFANAFLQMDVAPLWSILFFIMLILLGIDSQFGTLESLIYPFYDLKLVSMRKEIFTGIVAIVLLLVGISVVSPSGYYIFQIFDNYSLTFGCLLVGLFQTIGVSWVYGNDKFANDIEFMTGKRPSWLWLVCWKYISPGIIIVVVVANIYLIGSETLTYEAYVGCDTFGKPTLVTKEYPGWALFLIGLLISLPIIPIFAYFIMDFMRNPSGWIAGFKGRLCNYIEYMPDPSKYDLNRRYEEIDQQRDNMI